MPYSISVKLTCVSLFCSSMALYIFFNVWTLDHFIFGIKPIQDGLDWINPWQQKSIPYFFTSHLNHFGSHSTQWFLNLPNFPCPLILQYLSSIERALASNKIWGKDLSLIFSLLMYNLTIGDTNLMCKSSMCISIKSYKIIIYLNEYQISHCWLYFSFNNLCFVIIKITKAF